MSETLSVFVPGQPAPKGSKRAFMRPGMKFPVLVESSKEGVKSWEVALREVGARAMVGRQPFVDTPLELRIVFSRYRPKGHFTARGTRSSKWTLAPSSAPDLSKLVRATEDAWNKLVWDDDSRIVRIVATKIWVAQGRPLGALIEVEPAITLDGDEYAYEQAAEGSL